MIVDVITRRSHEMKKQQLWSGLHTTNSDPSHSLGTKLLHELKAQHLTQDTSGVVGEFC